ncbi:MAG: hypothetical protein GY854_04245 [Deltaproteobacteria bacterium]|nr:hypothetical protein [Deltaproteobacteria bacterium]
MSRVFRLVSASVLVAAMLCPALATAQEEGPPTGNKPVEAKFVGVAGGVIAGAELVVIVEAIIGVKPLWPYLTFPLLGAAGGGVGGYFLEQNSKGGAVALLIGSMALSIPTVLMASSARAFDPEEEGAVAEDGEAGGNYSFEQTPSGEAQPEDTSTEVESRPEGAPPEALPPPGTDDGGEVSPEPAPKPEPKPEPKPSEEGNFIKAKRQTVRATRSAEHRRATAGALLYLDSDGSAALTVPLIDVRPTLISREDAYLGVKPGVEVYVPLLRIDLP